MSGYNGFFVCVYNYNGRTCGVRSNVLVFIGCDQGIEKGKFLLCVRSEFSCGICLFNDCELMTVCICGCIKGYK